MTGALLCFGCGALYTVLHTYITHRMYPLYVGRRICVIRAGISFICCVAFVVGKSSAENLASGQKQNTWHFPATGCGITAVVIRDRSGLPSTFAIKDLHNRHRWHWGDNGFSWWFFGVFHKTRIIQAFGVNNWWMDRGDKYGYVHNDLFERNGTFENQCSYWCFGSFLLLQTQSNYIVQRTVCPNQVVTFALIKDEGNVTI